MFNGFKKWEEIKVKKVLHGHMFIGNDDKLYSLCGIICGDSREYLGDGLKAVFLIKKIFKQKIWIKKYTKDCNNVTICDVKTKNVSNLSEYLVDKYPALFHYKYGKNMKYFIREINTKN